MRVIDTGHTITLIHHVYIVHYPDGSTEEIIPASCVRNPGDEAAWVLQRARDNWARRRRGT